MKVLVLNGPCINMLGIREPSIYGTTTYDELISMINSAATRLSIEVSIMQSNHEGALVDAILASRNSFDAIIINPAAYTHTSVALLDALLCAELPAVEVHITDPSAREGFRQISYVRSACIKTIAGRGINGYIDALEYLALTQKD